MAKETKPRALKNGNLGSFVDAVTPEPKIVQDNFIQLDKLAEYLKKATPEQKEWVQSMIDIALSTTKQEEFLSLGERIALNTLKNYKYLFNSN